MEKKILYENMQEDKELYLKSNVIKMFLFSKQIKVRYCC